MHTATALKAGCGERWILRMYINEGTGLISWFFALGSPSQTLVRAADVRGRGGCRRAALTSRGSTCGSAGGRWVGGWDSDHHDRAYCTRLNCCDLQHSTIADVLCAFWSIHAARNYGPG